MEENLEQKLAKLEKADKAKSEFLSMITHQLRTPLAATKWTFKMLLDGDLGSFSDEQRKIIQKGSVSNERMIKLLNEVILANKSGEWDLQYETEPTDLERIIEDTITEYLEVARTLNIGLTFDRSKDPLPLLDLDSEKISIVFQNLIDNALKYSDGGSVKTSMQITEGNVEISVTDTGIGIPAGEQGQIFEKFFRATNAKEIKKEGTGLGLFTAQKIVERHGGKLSFVSSEKKGTTFTVTIPLPASQ